MCFRKVLAECSRLSNLDWKGPNPMTYTPLPLEKRLEAARYYLRHGFYPVPLCGPDCQNPRCIEKDSQGKVPHITNWAAIAARGDPAEALQLFRRFPRLTNVGIALRDRQVVIDVDPRNDGETSWWGLVDACGPLPDTPHAITGGGGQHWFASLPKGCAPIRKDLGDLGFPGIDIKQAGGQVVACPSDHVSGRRYEWEDSLELGQIPVAEVPERWLHLMAQARQQGRSQGKDGTDSGNNGHIRHYTGAEVREHFAASYAKGGRHNILATLIGMLGHRDICPSCAQRFLLWWQDTHLDPPLEPDELIRMIGYFYEHYGYDGSKCRHDHSPLLRRLMGATEDVNPATGEIVEPDPAAELKERMFWRKARQTGLRGTYAEQEVTASPDGASTENVTASPSSTEGDQIEIGSKIPMDSGREIRADLATRPLMHDPNGYVDNKILAANLRILEGAESEDATRLERCGWRIRRDCAQHGERKWAGGRCSCKSPDHPVCGSRGLTAKLRAAEMPDLEGDEAYLAVWFRRLLPTNPKYYIDTEPSFKDAIDSWNTVNKRARSWKATNGAILNRAFSFFLNRPLSAMYCKLLMKEESPGCLDGVLERIATQLKAEVVGKRRYQSGELAIQQLLEDASGALAGMADPDDIELYGIYHYAVKGRKVTESTGKLREILLGVELPEQSDLVCDICGEKLIKRVLSPEEEAAESQQEVSPAAGGATEVAHQGSMT